mgnify:CR=1 FL=1
MKLATANKKLDSIIENVEAKGLEADNLVEDLKELRGYALKEQDPLVTKVLRLTYEYLILFHLFINISMDFFCLFIR